MFHGVRLGQDCTDVTFHINNIEIGGFDYNIVIDNNTGHCFFRNVVSQSAYFGLYVRRGNADYSFTDSDFTNNRFAGIGMPRNTGINMGAFWKVHFGFSPYGIWQSNNADASPGNRQQGFLFQYNFLNCDFESVGNGAIHSEAQSDGGGVLQGCTFVGGWNDYNDDYRIGALNKDYFVNVPLCHYNLVDWGAQPWPTGDEGIIICGGTGAWTLRGIGTWPETTSVITGPTLYNALDPVNLTN